ncbi:sucrase ferredoxin [Enemella sp. A6]|uniref:sucrase ferredoxin n=1 Tax=Enemella sp. A6 TaxID=3440152 RepID=UPI003EC0D9A2
MTPAPPLAESCSMLHEGARVPAVGTAARAVAWVALEQNGAWGRLAPTQSHLDPELGATLEDRAARIGARIALLRNPGQHADVAEEPRRVYLAGGLDATPWMLTGSIDDPARLLDFDWALLTAPTPDGLLAALPELSVATEPVLLVCTNGKRDLCCALRGRPVALAAAEQRPGMVWETNHTGGHRFAPTGVMLPWGLTLARLDPQLAVLAIDAARREEFAPALLNDTHNRGLSGLAPIAQSAEHYIRQLVGELRLGVFRTQVRHDGLVEVARPGGHTWLVQVEERGNWPDLPASCGKDPVAVSDWHISVVR